MYVTSQTVRKYRILYSPSSSIEISHLASRTKGWTPCYTNPPCTNLLQFNGTKTLSITTFNKMTLSIMKRVIMLNVAMLTFAFLAVMLNRLKVNLHFSGIKTISLTLRITNDTPHCVSQLALAQYYNYVIPNATFLLY